MGRGKMKRRLSVDLVIVFLILAILPVLLANLLFHRELKRFVTDDVNTYNEKTIEQVGLQLDFVNTQLDETIQKLFSFIVYYDAFDTGYDNSSLEGLTATRKTDEVMSILKQSFGSISDIYLYNSAKLYSTNSAASRENLWNMYHQWIGEKEVPRGLFIVPAHSDSYIGIRPMARTADEKISFVYSVAPYRHAPEGGVIQIDIPSEKYEEVLEGLNVLDPLYICLKSGDETVLYRWGETVEITDSTEEGVFSFSYGLPKSGCVLEAVVSNQAYIQKMHKMERLLLLLGFIMGLVSLTIAVAVYRKILTPLKHMNHAFVRLSEGTFDLEIPVTHYQEFQTLGDSLCKMSHQLQTLMEANILEEKEKSEAEIKALQAQINPHFLYNVLEGIKWMALTENVPHIAKAIVNLVDMLEFSCNINDKYIKLSQEIQFIRNYIDIQSLRYGGVIDVDYRIEEKEELMDCRILKFILQPIVENAILHGFAKNKFDGRIIIDGYVEENDLVLTIADNGIGMEAPNKKGFSGIGIMNIQKRLKMNFGAAYGLEIESRPGEGTCVRIRIPRVTETGEGGTEGEIV